MDEMEAVHREVFSFLNLGGEYSMKAGKRNVCCHFLIVDALSPTLMHVGGTFPVQN